MKLLRERWENAIEMGGWVGRRRGRKKKREEKKKRREEEKGEVEE